MKDGILTGTHDLSIPDLPPATVVWGKRILSVGYTDQKARLQGVTGAPLA